mmetsp:Transcript_35895/g.85850  ORF Transcript_35895/g.85850 Transcript_35895/m.85850 type:complete len:332 (+) Transcript_35895:2-997(+)
MHRNVVRRSLNRKCHLPSPALDAHPVLGDQLFSGRVAHREDRFYLLDGADGGLEGRGDLRAHVRGPPARDQRRRPAEQRPAPRRFCAVQVQGYPSGECSAGLCKLRILLCELPPEISKLTVLGLKLELVVAEDLHCGVLIEALGKKALHGVLAVLLLVPGGLRALLPRLGLQVVRHPVQQLVAQLLGPKGLLHLHSLHKLEPSRFPLILRQLFSGGEVAHLPRHDEHLRHADERVHVEEEAVAEGQAVPVRERHAVPVGVLVLHLRSQGEVVFKATLPASNAGAPGFSGLLQLPLLQQNGNAHAVHVGQVRSLALRPQDTTATSVRDRGMI